MRLTACYKPFIKLLARTKLQNEKCVLRYVVLRFLSNHEDISRLLPVNFYLSNVYSTG